MAILALWSPLLWSVCVPLSLETLPAIWAVLFSSRIQSTQLLLLLWEPLSLVHDIWKRESCWIKYFTLHCGPFWIKKVQKYWPLLQTGKILVLNYSHPWKQHSNFFYFFVCEISWHLTKLFQKNCWFLLIWQYATTYITQIISMLSTCLIVVII